MKSNNPIKFIEMEMGGYFGNKVHVIVDLEKKHYFVNAWVDGEEQSAHEDSLCESEVRELRTSFEKCTRWDTDYSDLDVLDGYYWAITIDGNKYSGSNDVPSDWMEFFEPLNNILCLYEYSFDWTDYTNDKDAISLDDFIESIKEEHPQTYYKGRSLFYNGNAKVDFLKGHALRKASVIGSHGDEYEVSFEQWSDGNITSLTCSCPSAQKICKHMVAAVLEYKRKTYYDQYKEAEAKGQVNRVFTIDDDDLVKLLKVVCIEKVIEIKSSLLMDIKVCKKLIDEAVASVNPDYRAAVTGLNWYGMSTIPAFPQKTRFILYWGLKAIFEQVMSPDSAADAQMFQKALNGEIKE